MTDDADREKARGLLRTIAPLLHASAVEVVAAALCAAREEGERAERATMTDADRPMTDGERAVKLQAALAAARQKAQDDWLSGRHKPREEGVRLLLDQETEIMVAALRAAREETERLTPERYEAERKAWDETRRSMWEQTKALERELEAARAVCEACERQRNYEDLWSDVDLALMRWKDSRAAAGGSAGTAKGNPAGLGASKETPGLAIPAQQPAAVSGSAEQSKTPEWAAEQLKKNMSYQAGYIDGKRDQKAVTWPLVEVVRLAVADLRPVGEKYKDWDAIRQAFDRLPEEQKKP